jgi:hypothetical protein
VGERCLIIPKVVAGSGTLMYRSVLPLFLEVRGKVGLVGKTRRPGRSPKSGE